MNGLHSISEKAKGGEESRLYLKKIYLRLHYSHHFFPFPLHMLLQKHNALDTNVHVLMSIYICECHTQKAEFG